MFINSGRMDVRFGEEQTQILSQSDTVEDLCATLG